MKNTQLRGNSGILKPGPYCTCFGLQMTGYDYSSDYMHLTLDLEGLNAPIVCACGQNVK